MLDQVPTKHGTGLHKPAHTHPHAQDCKSLAIYGNVPCLLLIYSLHFALRYGLGQTLGIFYTTDPVVPVQCFRFRASPGMEGGIIQPRVCITKNAFGFVVSDGAKVICYRRKSLAHTNREASRLGGTVVWLWVKEATPPSPPPNGSLVKPRRRSSEKHAFNL